MSGFFGELYLRSTRPLISAATTFAEVDYLTRVFPKGTRLLNVGRGHGRHAWLLSSRGRPTVGVDLDLLSLTERESGAIVARADMRRLPFREHAFGGAFAWYSSLFIFEDAEHPPLLAELRRCLAPGATLVVQTVPFERFAGRRAEGRTTLTLPDGAKVIERSNFDSRTGRDVGVRSLTYPNGRVLSARYVIRYYPRPELERLFEHSGFRVKWLHGSLTGERLSETSAELIIGVERRDD